MSAVRVRVVPRRLFRHQALCLGDLQRQENHPVWSGHTVERILDVLDGTAKRFTIGSRKLGPLMGDIRGNIAVKHDDIARCKRLFQLGPGLESIARKQERHEYRVNLIERSKFAVQERTDKPPEERLVVARERNQLDLATSLANPLD